MFSTRRTWCLQHLSIFVHFHSVFLARKILENIRKWLLPVALFFFKKKKKKKEERERENLFDKITAFALFGKFPAESAEPPFLGTTISNERLSRGTRADTRGIYSKSSIYFFSLSPRRFFPSFCFLSFFFSLLALRFSPVRAPSRTFPSRWNFTYKLRSSRKSSGSIFNFLFITGGSQTARFSIPRRANSHERLGN